MGGCRCFEILGFDVMLTSQRKPYLIEVNHLPSLGCSSPVDVDVKRRVISQALDLTAGALPAMDQETYETLAKKRLPPARKVCPMLDCAEYKDYLRILPPTASCPPDLAAEYRMIQRRLGDVYKPVASTSTRRHAATDREISSPMRQLGRSMSATAFRSAPSTARERSVPASRAEGGLGGGPKERISEISPRRTLREKRT